MHHKQEKHLLRLKGTASRLFTGNQLVRKRFTNNHPEEEYLGFELAESKPLPITDEKLSEAIYMVLVIVKQIVILLL